VNSIPSIIKAKVKAPKDITPGKINSESQRGTTTSGTLKPRKDFKTVNFKDI
jgi:hypothetical protein